jgi:hypothetical protein
MTESMLEEGFLRRWARRKTESRLGVEPPAEAEAQPLPVPVQELASPVRDEAFDPASAAPEPRLPTMDDVAQLTPESDFSAFVARGVDQAVRRSALKKLFADPHFNVMDRLDVYIDDYTKPSPMPEGMLDSLQHAKKLFVRLAGDEEAPEALETPQAQAEAPAPAPTQAQTEQPPEQETP